MKKTFKPSTKIISFLLSVIMLVSCLGVGITSMAENQTFLGGNGVTVTDKNGWYNMQFIYGYTNAEANYKIDLTKGFYFQFVKAAWYTGFSFKETPDAEATPFQKIGDATNLSKKYTICGHANNEYIATNSLQPDNGIGQVDTQFFRHDLLKVQFKPVVFNGDIPTVVTDGSHTHFAVYINDVVDRICYERAVFEELNGYNSSSDTYSGCYITIFHDSNDPLEINLKSVVENEEIDYDNLMKTFSGSGVKVEDNDGLLDIDFTQFGTSATSNYKIDLTKGFYFQFVDAAWFTGIGFRETQTSGFTPFKSIANASTGTNEVTASLYTICGSTVDEYIATNTLTDQMGQLFTQFKRNDMLKIQFKPVKFNGSTPVEVVDGTHTHYSIYINGIAERICFTKADFEKLNGYKAETGTFSGCFIYISNGAAQKLRVNFKAATEEVKTFKGNSVSVIDQDNGWHNMDFIEYGPNATSNYKIDLTKGFYFQFVNAAWFTGISFRETEGGTPTPFNKIGDSAFTASKFTICGSPNDEYIATDSLESQMLGQLFTSFKRDDILKVQFRPVIINGSTPVEVFDGSHTHYAIYINGVADRICYERAVFERLNGYDSATGSFSGCYINISHGDSTNKLKLNFASAAILDSVVPTDKPFYGEQWTTTANKIPYDLTVTANKSVKSTFTVDLNRGLTFNLSAWPQSGCEWVTLAFAGDFGDMNTTADGRDTKTYCVDIRNNNGTIEAKAGGENYTNTGLSIADNHTVSFKAESGYYRLYIDDVAINGENATISTEKFEILNNYNETLDVHSGTFVRFASNSVFTFNGIREYGPEEEFINTSEFSSDNSSGGYVMTFGNQGTATATWQADLSRGILFKVDDLTDNNDEYVEFKLLSDYDDASSELEKSIRIRQKNGKLYGSIWNGTTESAQTDFGTVMNSTHTLKATLVNVLGEKAYRITIDGKSFSQSFDLTENEFKKINNYNKPIVRFDGTYIKFSSSQSAKVSIFAHADSPFIGEFVECGEKNNKHNLTFEDNNYAISTYLIDLKKGISFTLGSLNDVFSIRFADNLWNMSRYDNKASVNVQPIIKLRNVDGKISVSVSNDPKKDNYILSNSKIEGEHFIKAKKTTVKGVEGEVYSLYLDDVKISADYYLTVEQFDLINNYDANSNSFGGTTFRMASTKATTVNEIATTVAFEGINSNYTEVQDNHYDLSVGGWSYTVSKWKADLAAGISFTVENPNTAGWIMFRFASNFENMNTGIPGDKVNTYQPCMLIKQEGDQLYIAIMGENAMHISPTFLKGIKLEGTHVLSAKYVPNSRTGIMEYRFFLDGMSICTANVMNVAVFKKINGYNKATDSYDGVNIMFASSHGAQFCNIHALQVGETVEKNDWDANTDAQVEKVDENVYNLNMKALSSLRAQKTVDMEKGLTMTIENPAQNLQFGIALSMLPEGALLDVPPILTDEYSMYFMFTKNKDNTYSVMSTTGLTATYTGDLSGTHTYSLVKLESENSEEEEKYTLAIDGKAIFTDGIDKMTYLMITNASRGSFPTIFAMSDLIVKNLTGDFKENVVTDSGNLWDDDWEDIVEDEEIEDDDFDYSVDSDDFVEDTVLDDTEEDDGPRVERVLVDRVKIEQDPIITYVMNWWIVIAIIAAVGLVIGGIFTFVPFKKKEKKN